MSKLEGGDEVRRRNGSPQEIARPQRYALPSVSVTLDDNNCYRYFGADRLTNLAA
jgi:hypothetical protein